MTSELTIYIQALERENTNLKEEIKRLPTIAELLELKRILRNQNRLTSKLKRLLNVDHAGHILLEVKRLVAKGG